MKTLILLIIFVLISSSLFSQKEYHNWYFGDSAGVTFNAPDGEPIALGGNLSTVEEGTSIISDSLGNIKYFSADNCLYNSNRRIICDDDIIPGHYSMTQGSLLLYIGSDRFLRIGFDYSGDVKFLIFEEDKANDSIIVQKNKRLIKGFNGENLLVIRDFNSNSFYLLLHDRNIKEYILFKFDMDLLDFEELSRTKSEFKANSVNNTRIGYLKSSLDGRHIASFIYEQGIELLEFDNEELRIVKSFQFIDERFYSGEFSPNGDYLYYFTQYNTKLSYISGFKTNDYVINQISNSSDPKSGDGPFLLGPNRKIYIDYGNYLSSISNPDSINDIQYIAEDVDLLRGITNTSLPNIPTTFYNLLFVTDSISICLGETLHFTSELYAPFKDTIYSWTGPNNFSSDLPSPIINNANASDEGVYYLTVFNGDSSISYKRRTYVTVLPDPIPEISVSPDTIVCNSDFAELSVPLEYEDFEWTSGEKTHQITVLESGVYGVTYTNENGCTGYSEVNITFEKDLTTNILGETKICEGGTTTLSADSDYISYLWNTNETSKSIEVDKVGQYILTVETRMGCIISDTVDITYHPKVQAQLKPTPTTICQGDSTLLESKYDVPYYSYEWNTGATTKSIYVNSSDTYELIITDTRTGCMDSTEIAIKVEDNLQPTITGSNICSGESATLTALPNDPSYTYLWSNGEVTPVIVVGQAGIYSVTVSKAGCIGTAEYTVNESPTPEFEIIGENIICNNETATLSSNKDFAEYLWSTNEITKEIEVTEAGTYTLTVTDENGCTATESFTFDKYELSFDISKGSIDFGKVYITENPKDSVRIVNTSGFDVVMDLGGKIRLLDGQTFLFKKTLKPESLGNYSDSYSLHIIEPCDTIITIPITARLYARTTISTEDLYTQIGQTETVPVYLECETDLPAQEYTITTEIDRTAFFTNDSYNITQNQPINKTKTSIHNLTGTILLSDDLEYDITFPSYSFTNPYIEVIEQPGKIFIDSVCVFDFRSIKLVDPTTLDISPNPASEQLNIDITTGVQGAMKLELVATDGRVIYIDEWTQSTKSKQMQINTMNIPSGLYQVRLITPYDAITKSVVVVE
jgi:type IX secretion system substrate protein